MNQIVDQDIKQQIEVMQHYAAGGDVESKHIAARDGLAEWKENPSPEFDWVHFNYRIIGPSRVPFDAIQHMKDGGACIDKVGDIFCLENCEIKADIKFDYGDEKLTTRLLQALLYGDLKPYQEPEKAVIWQRGHDYALVYSDNIKYKSHVASSGPLPLDEENKQILLAEIAQGKWERVDV